MLLLCAILLIFLIISAFYSVQLYKSMGKEIKEEVTSTKLMPINIEDKVAKGAKDYYQKYYGSEITGTITVTTKNLLEYNILESSDLAYSALDKCSGYALLKKENNEIEASPYIKCKNYETVGFEEWRISNE